MATCGEVSGQAARSLWRRADLRHSGRPHGRALSRPAGDEHPPHHAAPRAGRRLHGRRLCPRHRQAGRLLHHHRAGHDQYRHRDGAGLCRIRCRCWSSPASMRASSSACGTAACTSCRSQQGLVSGVTAFSHTLLAPSQLPEILACAFAVFSSSRPRPVHIEIPLDVIVAEVDDSAPAAWTLPGRAGAGGVADRARRPRCSAAPGVR